MGEKLGDKAPRIFYVNWFRKSAEGKFLWPGFSENSRVLKWMCERVEGKAGAKETPVGLVPEEGSLDLEGLDIDSGSMKELMEIDTRAWKNELEDIEGHFNQFGDRKPARLMEELEALKKRLG
jgi:phosphoenolpyruvate carboxykinase (GTP)